MKARQDIKVQALRSNFPGLEAFVQKLHFTGRFCDVFD